MPTLKKPLGIFSLAMMNVIAIDSLRSLPIAAQFGFSLIFFYLLAGVFFFIPTALITAELATCWPTTGGAYIWIRTAFGKHWGWFAIWLQWIYNVVWYPTILIFIIGTLAYLFFPTLSQHKGFILALLLCFWWTILGISYFGLPISKWLSNVGALIGTLLPMLLIIALGAMWLFNKHPLAIHFSTTTFFPNLKNSNELTFLTTIIFGLMGLEMSAVHAEEVRHPRKDFPFALLISVILILSTLIFSSLAIALIIPSNQLSVLTGLTDAFVLFFHSYHLIFFTPIIISLIILGSLCSISTWVIGPTKGLLVASAESNIKNLTWFIKLNRYGAPWNLLILQGLLVTVLATLFIYIPTVTETYWLLSVLTAQLALLFYMFLFSATLYLRYKKHYRPEAYKIPGGKVGLWLVCGMGLLTCIIVFGLGFLPPSNIKISSIARFDAILLFGLIFFCIPPFFVTKLQKN